MEGPEGLGSRAQGLDELQIIEGLLGLGILPR